MSITIVTGPMLATLSAWKKKRRYKNGFEPNQFRLNGSNSSNTKASIITLVRCHTFEFQHILVKLSYYHSGEMQFLKKKTN